MEKDLLVKLHPALPEHIVVKMVDFANEIRKQFIGASDSYTDTIEVTLSTRTLLRWADQMCIRDRLCSAKEKSISSFSFLNMSMNLPSVSSFEGRICNPSKTSLNVIYFFMRTPFI